MIKDPKLQELRAHAAAWRDRFEKLQDQKLAEFATQPLDKKTAIICTAFIVDALKELTSALAEIAQTLHPEMKTFDYLYSDPDSPLKGSDEPRAYIANILTEVCGGSGQDTTQLVDAYCNTINFDNAYYGALKEPSIIDREWQRIKETPLPEEKASR